MPHHRTSPAGLRSSKFATLRPLGLCPFRSDLFTQGCTIASPSFSQAWSALFSAVPTEIRINNRPRATDRTDRGGPGHPGTAGTTYASWLSNPDGFFVTFRGQNIKAPASSTFFLFRPRGFRLDLFTEWQRDRPPGSRPVLRSPSSSNVAAQLNVGAATPCFVAMAPRRIWPASATIWASCRAGVGVQTLCVMPPSVSIWLSISDFSMDVVPTRTGCPIALASFNLFDHRLNIFQARTIDFGHLRPTRCNRQRWSGHNQQQHPDQRVRSRQILRLRFRPYGP